MSKIVRKKRKKRLNTRYYWLCDACALEMGASYPEGGLMGCTVTHGRCPYCKAESTLIPWVDFNWPTHKAIWD